MKKFWLVLFGIVSIPFIVIAELVNDITPPKKRVFGRRSRR